jgi:hypothetical protein
LRLVAVTVRWNHQPLRDLIRDLRPVIAPYQMQQHVETCCRARRGEHLPWSMYSAFGSTRIDG